MSFGMFGFESKSQTSSDRLVVKGDPPKLPRATR